LPCPQGPQACCLNNTTEVCEGLPFRKEIPLPNIIGLEWNPNSPNWRIIDLEGNPLSVTPDEIDKHPVWSNIDKAPDGYTLPTFYFKHISLPNRTCWWLSCKPQDGFTKVLAQIVPFRPRNLSGVLYQSVWVMMQIEYLAWKSQNITNTS